jgi:hypothetical protein
MLLAMSAAGLAQQATTAAATRVWTNTNGKQLTAEYLGIRGGDVALRLPGGKISFVPLSGLSTADNAFVKANRLDYHERWQSWPADASQSMPALTVSEEAGAAGTYTYTTKNFRFRCDVNLGATLMKDLARTFELTLQLHAKSPFGILAKPEKDRFEAKLFGKLDDYRKAGGPGQTAGVYLPKQKVFLAPLELMGVEAGSGSAGYRKISDEYDVSTIVHELTHMLTHEMLGNLPLWVNEGYAEYIASIPIQAKVFKTDPAKIRESIRDVIAVGHFRTLSDKQKAAWGKEERDKYLQGSEVPPLYRIANVLQMTDDEWTKGYKPLVSGPVPDRSGPVVQYTPVSNLNRLPRLYRTAHLIIYYFIQIEGEKGVTKLRKFLEENRRNLDRLEQLNQDFEDYEKAMVAFMAQPGVEKLPDGRFRYPANLTPPKAPEGAPPDLNSLKLGGLSFLLEGESAEVVGERIQSALRKDLEINLTFQ